MALAQAKQRILPLAEERRRFQRVRVNLLGRYMLADRREYPCQVANMSPGGMAIIAPVSGQAGERVIAYIDHVGRLEGTITRLYQNGFAMTVAATARKRDKLAAQLTWLANRHILGLPEDRRHGRVVPKDPVTHAGHARHRAGPGGPPPRGRVRGRVHAAAAPRLPRREHLRRVNAFAQFRSARAGLLRPALRFGRPFGRLPRPAIVNPRDARDAIGPQPRGRAALMLKFESN